MLLESFRLNKKKSWDTLQAPKISKQNNLLPQVMDLSDLARRHTRAVLEKLDALQRLTRLRDHKKYEVTYQQLGVYLQNIKELEAQVTEQFPELLSFGLLPFWSPDAIGDLAPWVGDEAFGNLCLRLHGGIVLQKKHLQFSGELMARSATYFALYNENSMMVVYHKFTGNVVLEVRSVILALHDDRAVTISKDEDSLQVWQLKLNHAELLHQHDFQHELAHVEWVQFLRFNGEKIQFVHEDVLYIFDSNLVPLNTWTIDKEPGVSIQNMDLYGNETMWVISHSYLKRSLVLGQQPLKGQVLAQNQRGYHLWQGVVYEQRPNSNEWRVVPIDMSDVVAAV